MSYFVSFNKAHCVYTSIFLSYINKTWSPGDKVKAKDIDGYWYSAVVKEVSGTMTKVHYNGWSKRYDRWVKKSDIKEKKIIARI